MNDAGAGVQGVLLVGGDSELGLAILAQVDLRPGAHVVLAGRSAGALRRAGAELAARAGAGVTVSSAVFDALGPPAAGPQLLAEAAQRVGELDLVVLAVGVLGDQRLAEVEPAESYRILVSNAAGLAPVLLAAAAALRRQGHGTLVVLSSAAGVRARRVNYVYGASKAALDALAVGTGEALRGSGARVLVVRPGFVRGRMTAGRPVAPLATQPAAVAEAVAAALRRGERAARGGPEIIWVPRALAAFGLLARLAPQEVFRRLPG